MANLVKLSASWDGKQKKIPVAHTFSPTHILRSPRYPSRPTSQVSQFQRISPLSQSIDNTMCQTALDHLCIPPVTAMGSKMSDKNWKKNVGSPVETTQQSYEAANPAFKSTDFSEKQLRLRQRTEGTHSVLSSSLNNQPWSNESTASENTLFSPVYKERRMVTLSKPQTSMEKYRPYHVHLQKKINI